MKYILRNIFILGLLFTAISANANDNNNFNQLAKSWEQSLTQIQSSIERKSQDNDKLKEFQTTLRKVKVSANAEISQAKTLLKNEKDLLAVLGEVPEEPQNENKKVREQRKKLNDSIEALDAIIKQANLMIARVDEELSAIEAALKQKVQDQILAYEGFPVTEEELLNLFNSSSLYLKNFDNWEGLIYLGIGLLSIAFISFPITKHLNALILKAPGIEAIKPIHRFRLMLLGFAAYFVFLMRFGIIDIQTAPAFENLLEVIASICLATVLFIALGRIRFITPKLDNDIIGEQKKSYSWLWNGFNKIVRLTLLTVPLMSIFGYATLGLYIAFNILATIVAILLFVVLRILIAKIICKMSVSPEGEKKEEEAELSPFAITIIEPVLALFAMVFALFFWGMTTEDLTTWFERYKDGIPIGDVTIDFINLGSAIAMFFSAILFTRLIQWFISKRVFPYTNLDLGLRDAISTITGYIGIIMAVLVSLGAVGIDLSNLAIVAGALSVGIGFGLQSIFNNFVSGLILLFERPVKVGDWIVVGEHQGVIKKIRVRSTEIETFQNSSIIVPNSQLISETVTNWTLYDKVGRVDISVGVAYGTDTEKVKEVLLKVAEENTSVRNSPKPNVFFMGFGDSSLDFELRCFIRNIRDVFSVSSQLRFAVNTAFLKNDIEIPFPQRDLHIKDSEGITIKSKKTETKKTVAKKPASKKPVSKKPASKKKAKK